MAQRSLQQATAKLQSYASVFAALGDRTRLSLVSKLADGETCSITQLTGSFKLSRQAVTKHLRVLEDAGLVRGIRSGRERIFELDSRPFKDLQEHLDVLSTSWESSLKSVGI